MVFFLCLLSLDLKMVTLPPASCSTQKEKKEGRKKRNAIIRKVKTYPEISVRLLFMCQRTELCMWPPLPIRESERAYILVAYFSIINKIGVLIVKKRSMDIV